MTVRTRARSLPRVTRIIMDGPEMAHSEALADGRQDERRAHEDRIRQDEAVHGRLQRLLLDFDRLLWEGRQSLALKASGEILAEFGFEMQADEGEAEWVRVSGWGQHTRVPVEQLKVFLRDLVRPRPRLDADATCRNCGSSVMADDPGCWHCSASFLQREWRPEAIGRNGGGLKGWWRRLIS